MLSKNSERFPRHWAKLFAGGFYSTNPEVGEFSESNLEWVLREVADLRKALNHLESEMTFEKMAAFVPACNAEPQ